MGKLREPISGRQAALILGATGGLLASRRWLGDLSNPLVWGLLSLALELVVQPLSTLIHELGHAVAVTALGRRESTVIVGRGPWITAELGRVTVRFSCLPNRGVLIRGLCRYDASDISWRSRAFIALAGPLATLLELIAVVAVAPVLWSSGPFARYLILLSAAGLIGSLITNAIPRPARADGDRAFITERDGWQARRALARHRAGAPPPRASPEDDPDKRRYLEAQLRVARTSAEQLARRLADIEQQRDRDHAATSIPPPTRDIEPA